MPYGKFNSYEEVAIQFQIKFIETSFIQENPFKVPEGLFDFIDDNSRFCEAKKSSAI